VSRSTNPPNRRHGSLPEIDIYIGKINKAVEKLVERRHIPFRRASTRFISTFTSWISGLRACQAQRCTRRWIDAPEQPRGVLLAGSHEPSAYR
jgi:hypothetical protein